MKVMFHRHLQAIALVQLAADRAADQLADVLGRFGPTRVDRLEGWGAVREYLTPLYSMPTRYVVVPAEGWSLLLVNMRLQPALVDALALSQRSGCLAVGANLMPDSRQFHLIRAGKEVRDVACYQDGSKWFFVARGEPQQWESTISYTASRKRDRFTPEMAASYVERVTGLRFPLAWREVVRSAVGIERSIKDVRVPIATFEVEDDI